VFDREKDSVERHDLNMCESVDDYEPLIFTHEITSCQVQIGELGNMEIAHTVAEIGEKITVLFETKNTNNASTITDMEQKLLDLNTKKDNYKNLRTSLLQQLREAKTNYGQKIEQCKSKFGDASQSDHLNEDECNKYSITITTNNNNFPSVDHQNVQKNTLERLNAIQVPTVVQMATIAQCEAYSGIEISDPVPVCDISIPEYASH
jgi:hypothetical protein